MAAVCPSLSTPETAFQRACRKVSDISVEPEHQAPPAGYPAYHWSCRSIQWGYKFTSGWTLSGPDLLNALILLIEWGDWNGGATVTLCEAAIETMAERERKPPSLTAIDEMADLSPTPHPVSRPSRWQSRWSPALEEFTTRERTPSRTCAIPAA